MTVSTKDRNHQDINQYRDFAEQCLRLAKAAKTEHERQVLHEMAETWRRLAEEAGPEKF
jgi:phage-related minor tail protein